MPSLRHVFALAILFPLALSAQQITAVSGGTGGMVSTNIAPGGIFTISGTGLAAAPTDLFNFTGSQLPTSLGGVQVMVGGKSAAIFMVAPTAIVAQVPVDAPNGSEPVIVTSGSNSSPSFSATVAATAPALVADSSGGIALRSSDYSVIGAANPALAGDTLLLYGTGFGISVPSLGTGMIPSANSPAFAIPVTVAVNGVQVPVLYAAAAPMFAGLAQIAVQLPAGISGTVPVTVTSGGNASRPVSIITGAKRAAILTLQEQAIATEYQRLAPRPLYNFTPQEARMLTTVADAVRAILTAQGMSTAPEAVAQTRDITVAGAAGNIPARIYTPAGSGPFPVIVYFHGGGFVIATIDVYDSSARALANAAGAIVVSVEYRKAPENRFPAAPEDAYAATQWAFANATSFNGIANRIAVVGESAAGNLATVVCQLARDRKGKMPFFQGLVYPVTNFSSDTPSYEENANAPFLMRAGLRWFGSYYLNTMQDALNPEASPLLGNLAGLPPATVITDGFDPLRDEGAAYADKLRQAGVTVDYRNYPGQAHEFFGTGAVNDTAKQAVAQLAIDLKAAATQAP